MTHKILDHDTQKIIYRSAVRPKKSSTPNHKLAPHGGEVSASSDPSEILVFKMWDKAILDKHKKVKNPPKGYHRIKAHLVLLSSLMADIKLDWWLMAT